MADRSASGPRPDQQNPSGTVYNGQLAQMDGNTVKANPTDARAFPQDLPVPPSRILARLATGDVKAATPTEISTLLASAAPYTGSVTAALAKLTVAGANGSLKIDVANGIVTGITYSPPT